MSRNVQQEETSVQRQKRALESKTLITAIVIMWLALIGIVLLLDDLHE